MKPRMGTDHNNGASSASQQWRCHGTNAVKCSGQVRGNYLSPILFPLSEYKAASSDSGIADEHGRRWYQAEAGCHHLFDFLGLANIGFEERPGSTGSHDPPERILGGLLVPIIMNPDRPASRSKGQADGATDPSGRTGHKDCRRPVDLV